MPFLNRIVASGAKNTDYNFDGRQSIIVTGTGSSINIPVEVQPDTNYYFNSAIKVNTGTFSVRIDNIIWPRSNLFISDSHSDSEFHIIDTVIKTPSSCSTVDVKVSGSSNSSCYFDNVIFLKSLITNGNFETTTGWDTSNCNVVINDANERTGTYCLQVTATSNNGYVYRDITVTDGQWYTFSFYGKSSASGHRLKFQIIGNSTSTSYYDSGWIDSTSYKKRVRTFNNVTDTSVRIKCIVESSSEIVYIDDWAAFPLIDESPSTETGTTLANSYGMGAWDENPVGSLHIQGSDLYSIPIATGTNLNKDEGSLSIRIKPDYDYDEYLDDAYIFNIPRFARVYYNHSDYRFYGEIYNGNEFVSSGCYSYAQLFTSGTWIHVGFSYDNNYGIKLILSGNQVAEFMGTWEEQPLPVLMAIGSISGTDYNRINGYIDDFNMYARSINISDFQVIYNKDNEFN